MSIQKFCAEAYTTTVRAIFFNNSTDAESVNQYLRDGMVRDRILYFADPAAAATAVELAGLTEKDYCFVGGKCRLPMAEKCIDSDVPKVYCACLSSYNNGQLHGMWIDATQEPEDIHSDIEYMLSYSPEDDAEEWAWHSYEGFEGVHLSEYESVETISELAQAIDEHGTAFAAYWKHFGGEDDCSVDDFQDKYLGIYKNEEEFVYEMWEQDGTFDKLEAMGISSSYIDCKAIATDWFINDYFSAVEGYETCHVFYRQ